VNTDLEQNDDLIALTTTLVSAYVSNIPSSPLTCPASSPR